MFLLGKDTNLFFTREYIQKGGERGQVAALAGSHMNGLLPFKRTIEQKTGTMPIAVKIIATATIGGQ